MGISTLSQQKVNDGKCAQISINRYKNASIYKSIQADYSSLKKKSVCLVFWAMGGR